MLIYTQASQKLQQLRTCELVCKLRQKSISLWSIICDIDIDLQYSITINNARADSLQQQLKIFLYTLFHITFYNVQSNYCVLGLRCQREQMQTCPPAARIDEIAREHTVANFYTMDEI